ncbi:MAG TPA: hypothetical protein VM577_08295 [Anaerovoracaceae bacterium]|nr:hypothetical protein [Anaerovoracaceae bacterium]
MAARCRWCKQTDHLGLDCPTRDPDKYYQDIWRQWALIQEVGIYKGGTIIGLASPSQSEKFKARLAEETIMDQIHGPKGK